MSKLTKAQAETLALIDAGKVTYNRCGTAAWRIWGAPPGVVGKLVSLGYAANDWPNGSDTIPYTITPAGRAALNTLSDGGGKS